MRKSKIYKRGRKCFSCNKSLTWNFFQKDKYQATGYKSICKSCTSIKQKEKRKNIEYKEKFKLYKKKYLQSEKGKLTHRLYTHYYMKFKNNIKILKSINEWKPKKIDIDIIKNIIIEKANHNHIMKKRYLDFIKEEEEG